MLNNNAFEQWCQRLALSEQTRTLIAHIRSSPPSRLVQSAAGNMSGRYPSKKMGCSIQFESRRDELAFIYELEHDPTVLEFYDQPGKIHLTYHNKSGTRQVHVRHTPDFFVIREDGAGWTECKMEEHLVRLTQEQPHRYQHRADGSWCCPPGEAYAASFGLFYSLRSSRATNWIYLRNLRFLEEYVRSPHVPDASAMVETIRTTVMRRPGISLLELLHTLHTGGADDVYFLIVTDQLYIDLSQALLADPERVQVFPDREVAASQAVMQSSAIPFPHPSTLTLAVGTPLWWDGRAWTVFNPGVTEITLLSEDQQLKAIPTEAFDTLLRDGKLTILSSPTYDSGQAAARSLLEQASPQHLAVALQRYRALGHRANATIPARTLRRWQARFLAAEAAYGNGFVGLLPDWRLCGNRTPRLSGDTEAVLDTFITDHYETLKQQPKQEVFLLLQREAEYRQLPAPSYSTFLRRIALRSRPESIRKRQGSRAAAQVEPWYWELEQTTPRHGDRPWEIVHMDHTQLDLELVSAKTGRPLGRPWATFLTDAFSRRLLVVYLTFDPPSYRSCMMALRECVWRYARLPQTIIVDGGPDFKSTYFETLLAYYSCTKATRPWARPRFGSVCERLFGTANTQFIHNLLGNTQITKQVRQVTKAVAPREQAVWTLGDLYTYLCAWAYEVYDLALHPALGTTPREAFQMGLARCGERAHLKILYDDDFRFLSLATTRKGTAKVEPGRGVKIHYLYYWSESLLSSAVERAQVPVRYDPFDIGTAYVFVQGRWVLCRSEYYLQLRGHSERELQLASAELRKRYQNHAGEAAITAKRLADFLAQAEAQEALLVQRLHDLEAREVFARLGGYHVMEQAPALQSTPPSSSSPSSVHHPTTSASMGVVAECDDDIDVDIYEEYR